MATLGKTTTPSTPTFGWVQNFGSVAMSFTTSQAGWYTSVSFWAAGSSLKIHGVIWDASGNVLAFGPGVVTSGGTASGTGATQWWTDTFSGPVFIPGGVTVFVGWQTDTHTQYEWGYNGNDHSPNAVTLSSAYGSTGQSLAGYSTESPNGAVAAYATYTPAGIKVRRSGAWVLAPVYVRRSGAWVPVKVYVRRSGAWVWIG